MSAVRRVRLCCCLKSHVEVELNSKGLEPFEVVSVSGAPHRSNPTRPSLLSGFVYFFTSHKYILRSNRHTRERASWDILVSLTLHCILHFFCLCLCVSGFLPLISTWISHPAPQPRLHSAQPPGRLTTLSQPPLWRPKIASLSTPTQVCPRITLAGIISVRPTNTGIQVLMMCSPCCWRLAPTPRTLRWS
jgi:hypothetical protein